MKHELIYDVDHGQRCAGWYLRTDDGEDLVLRTVEAAGVLGGVPLRFPKEG